jgi:hypothetical protein
MSTRVFRTKDDAEAWALALRDSFREERTGCIWARDPETRALGKVYITPCVAFTRGGKRVAAFSITFGA